MRDTWYGDRRDIVKWGTLAHIAERARAGAIVQIPYFRRGGRALLQFGKESAAVPDAVWDFFREIRAVQKLGPALGCEIRVFDEPFEHRNRQAYIAKALRYVAQTMGPKVVLLDPDTGLAPSKAQAQHAAVADIQALWQILSEGDRLVLYQHASRNTGWLVQGEDAFATACGVSAVEVYRAPGIASDVAFFVAGK